MIKTSKNTGTAIVFDLGGVLIDWNPKHLYKKMFNGQESAMDAFLTNVCNLEWNHNQDLGYPFAKAIEERMIRFPEYAPYIQAYYTRWEEMVKGPISGTVAILSLLRESGYPLFALSNWSAETYPKVDKRFDFLAWFDTVVLSGEEKLAKPDPAIYHLLLDRINYEAEQCIFIDDSEKNITAAKELGFQAIHFTSPEDLHLEMTALNLLPNTAS